MDFESGEEQRVDFNGIPEDGTYVNGEWVPLDSSHNYGFNIPKSKYYSSTWRKSKIGAGIPILGVMLVIVIVATFATLSFRLFLQSNKNKLSVGGSIIGGVVNSVVIIIMNLVWRIIADKLNNWENHRTQTEYDDALTFKIFLFQFVNSYTSLYYIAFFKKHNHFWNVKNSDQHDACKVLKGSQNGTIGYGCTVELTIQLGTLLVTNMVIGQTREVMMPWIMSIIRVKMLQRKAAAEGTPIEDPEATLPQWELDGKLSPYQGTFDEYSEMVIQFGYVTLFASAFPLAPFLAVLNNIVEIRTDAFKLLAATVRPHYRGGQDIGSWYKILEALGVISVVTNCLLLGFSFKAISDLFNTASPFNRKFQIFAFAVVLEHIVLLLKYVIAELIPDVPGWVRQETARSDFIKDQTFRRATLSERKVYEDTEKEGEKEGEKH